MDDRTAKQIEKHLRSISKSLEEIAKNTKPIKERDEDGE